jgi:hypothetical protein
MLPNRNTYVPEKKSGKSAVEINAHRILGELPGNSFETPMELRFLRLLPPGFVTDDFASSH